MSILFKRLNNGIKIPTIGLGTYRLANKAISESIRAAFANKCYHFDCARVYGNEKEVGNALEKNMKECGIDRGNLFITTKIFNNCHRKKVQSSLEKSLKDLKIDYVDLLLLHWPVEFRNSLLSPLASSPSDSFLQLLSKPSSVFGSSYMDTISLLTGKIMIAKIEYLETWKEFERLYELGMVKSIGVSNFTISQLVDLLNNCKIQPCVNQIECHPYNTQIELREFCKKNNIIVEAYSPLGSGGSSYFNKSVVPLLQNNVIKEIAKNKKVSTAQVLVKWSVINDMIPLPRSSSFQHVSENFKISDFDLNDEDIKRINDLNMNIKYIKGWVKGNFL